MGRRIPINGRSAAPSASRLPRVLKRRPATLAKVFGCSRIDTDADRATYERDEQLRKADNDGDGWCRGRIEQHPEEDSAVSMRRPYRTDTIAGRLRMKRYCTKARSAAINPTAKASERMENRGTLMTLPF